MEIYWINAAIDTILKTKEFCDSSGLKISVLIAVFKPRGAKGVIYNVPKDIADNELLNCLKRQKVSFIRSL